MRELVLETIINQPDIEIIAEIHNENEIAHIVKGTHPDFLIIALDESNQTPSPLRHLAPPLSRNEDPGSGAGTE